MAKRAPRASGTAKSAPTRASKAKPETTSKTLPKAKGAGKPASAAPAKAAVARRGTKAAAGKTAAAPVKPASTGKAAIAKPNGGAGAEAGKSSIAERTPTVLKTAKASAKTPTKAAAKAPKKAAAKSSTKRPTAKPKTSRDKKTKTPKPRYLAAELGQPVDHDGEPVGAGSARARSDGDLQKYALQLWRQMQSGRVVNRYTRAIERAGLTADEVWTAGLAEMRTTSSTADEIRRYRQKVLFRANLLEAIFTETIADLRRLDRIEPADAAAAVETS